MKSSNKKIIVLILLILILSAFMVGCKPAVITKTYTVGDGETLTVGIISDTQLPGGDDYDSKYYRHYVSALTTLKMRNVDSIIFAGDLADVLTKDTAEMGKKAWDEVYGDDNQSPVRNFIMGNHDYWLPNFFDCWDIPVKSKMHKRFEYATGEAPNSHKVINGYHFINISPDNGKMNGAYKKAVKWAEKELEAAVSDNPERPIFVTTHNHPKNTVYGSQNSEAELNDLFSRYPQIVSISGHSHRSMLDATSIWQGEYTAINTQSLSYTALGGNIENGGGYEGLPSMMIMNINNDKIDIERLNALTGEKIADNWTIDMPIKDNLNKYNHERRKNISTPPKFPENSNPEIVSENGDYYLKLPHAVSSDSEITVRYYRVEVIDKNDGNCLKFNYNGSDENYMRFITSFYRIDRDEFDMLKLNPSIPSGNYKLIIYAEDCYGQLSSSLTLNFSK